MYRSICRLLRIVVIALPWVGAVAHAASELELVNALRLRAGLPVLADDARLAGAAARHAAYLDRHREPGVKPQGVSAHQQQPGREGFSGETPADRALNAGYPHREVLENVSMGFGDTADALGGLMGAVYHRLTFLDLEADRMGVAVGDRSRVFLLGRSDMARLCESPPQAALSRRPVDCLGRPMTRAYYERMCAAVPARARFQSSHPVSCPDGSLLDAGFMAEVCARPPPAARFRGHGRYYEPCADSTRLDADWFDRLCREPPDGAAYGFSGRYYEICNGPVRVHAEWLEGECAALPQDALYTDSGRFRRPCADDTPIRIEYLEELDAASRRQLPELVVWPPDGADAVPPAFFIEEPDPLPDLEVSGYPLTVQFNPSFSHRVALRSFALYRLDGDRRRAVAAVRLLDQSSDPNGLLGAHEFALFPLQRLAWGAGYVAVIEADVDDRPLRHEWQFRTAGADTPLLTATEPLQSFRVASGTDYLLYLPPREGRPHTVLQSRTKHLRGNSVALDPVDPNTLRVRVRIRYCDPVKIQFDEGRRVELVAQHCPG